MLPLTDADHQRTAQPGADDQVGVSRTEDSQAISPFQTSQRCAHGLDQVAAEMMSDELGDHLGVGLALEDDAFGFELPLERGVILDDAVMDNGDGAVAADVRVCVDIVCRAVRRPARVTDADTAGRWALLQVCHKIGDAAGPFPQVHVRAGQRRQAGAVVAAILEPAKAFDENWFRLFGTDVADDATHP